MLALHLTGALLMLVLVSTSLFSVYKSKVGYIKTHIKLLFLNFLFQSLTGILLAVESGSGVLATCAKLGVYLVIWGGIEGALLFKLRDLKKGEPVLQD